MIVGSIGMAASMVAFGTSKTYKMMVGSRILGGDSFRAHSSAQISEMCPAGIMGGGALYVVPLASSFSPA